MICFKKNQFVVGGIVRETWVLSFVLNSEMDAMDLISSGRELYNFSPLKKTVFWAPAVKNRETLKWEAVRVFLPVIEKFVKSGTLHLIRLHRILWTRKIDS